MKTQTHTKGLPSSRIPKPVLQLNYYSETEQKLLINMNEGELQADMFPPSH